MAEYARPADWPDVPLVDTDVHITPRSIGALVPYLPARWRDYLRESGVSGLESDLYPPRSPLSAIPGSRPADGPPASDPELLRAQLLDPWRLHLAVTHCIYGIDGIHNPDWAVAMARAVNDWQYAEWLDGRTAAARIGRRRGPGPGLGGGGDRPGRRPPGVRAGAPAGTDARAAGHPGVLADLRGRRAPRPGARRARGRRERQPVTPVGCAELLPGGVRRAVRRPSRPRSSASSAKACRCGSRTCRSCWSSPGSPGCRR